MANYDAFLDLDGNGRPIYGDSPFKAEKSVTFTGNNTTVNTPIFTLSPTTGAMTFYASYYPFSEGASLESA